MESNAKQEPVAWKHDCAALLTNDVELWIDACPHCGKPRPAPQPKPAEQEPRPCHVFNVTKNGSLTEWEPTTMAFALPDGKYALYTAPQPAIPPGYKLVPEVPTNEWINNLAKIQTGPLEDVPFADIYQCIAELLDTAPEAPQPAKPAEQPQEPSAGGVLFAVEQAIRNGDCPWQIEQAFDEYEAERRNSIKE